MTTIAYGFVAFLLVIGFWAAVIEWFLRRLGLPTARQHRHRAAARARAEREARAVLLIEVDRLLEQPTPDDLRATADRLTEQANRVDRLLNSPKEDQ